MVLYFGSGYQHQNVVVLRHHIHLQSILQWPWLAFPYPARYHGIKIEVHVKVQWSLWLALISGFPGRKRLSIFLHATSLNGMLVHYRVILILNLSVPIYTPTVTDPGEAPPPYFFSEIVYFLWTAWIIFTEFSIHSQAFKSTPPPSWRSGSTTDQEKKITQTFFSMVNLFIIFSSSVSFSSYSPKRRSMNILACHENEKKAMLPFSIQK